MSAALFDAVLAFGLVLVAWRCLSVRDLFTAVVLFIVFGLLMALAWARLDAPDIALAEAAIGAGLTGALLLDALGHIAGRRRDPKARDDQAIPQTSTRAGVAGRLALGLAAAGGAAVLAIALWHLPRAPVGGAGQRALLALQDHPVSNAVTAVLLDLRAYDTFLEMGVLMLAGLGALLLSAHAPAPPQAAAPARRSRLLAAMTAQLVPLMLLMAVYLYWAGTALAGGAFPAGALLGAAGVLLILSGRGGDLGTDNRVARAGLTLGLAAFLIAGAGTMAAGRRFLEWGEHAYLAILAIEGVLVLAIGGTLALIYAASARKVPRTAATDTER